MESDERVDTVNRSKKDKNIQNFVAYRFTECFLSQIIKLRKLRESDRFHETSDKCYQKQNQRNLLNIFSALFTVRLLGHDFQLLAIKFCTLN